jgi:hypothetical protein
MSIEFLALTLRAYAYELQLMTKNVKSLKIPYGRLVYLNRRIVEVRDPAALSAANVVVMLSNSVEPRFVVAGVELLDQPGPSQQIQVSIYRSEADVGKPLSHYLVKSRR